MLLAHVRRMHTADDTILARPPVDPGTQPLGDLVGKLSTDLQQLARQEAELATREVGKKLDDVKAQAAALAVGLVALCGGGLVLLAAAVLGLAQVMAAWAAALLVGAIVVALGIALVLSGKAKLSRVSLMPERALENVKRDVAAMKGAAT